MTPMDTFVNPHGTECCDRCEAPLEFCGCRCSECGDALVECACEEGP